MTTFESPTPATWQSDKTKISKTRTSKITVGVLALQGDFLEHIQILRKLNAETKEVRLPEDLEKIDAIILPGGESTTMARLLDVFKLRGMLREKILSGMPVWGTCAGMILLAKKLMQDKPETLGLMDIIVNRNAYGRQIDSFDAEIRLKPLGDKPLKATFIRAPKIAKTGPGVDILGKLEDGEIVAVREGNMLATSFHPELSEETKMHEYFLSFVY